MTNAVRREEALRSALGRLPVAVIIVDGERTLQPYNGRATELFRREALRGDLLEARPSHPLSQMIQEILDASTSDPSSAEERSLKFPSGCSYRVEPSRRSEKGMNRWLMLLLTPVEPGAAIALDEYDFTVRERQLAELLLEGAQTAAICTALNITGNTLKTHMRGLLEKSGTRNRAEFVTKLLRPR